MAKQRQSMPQSTAGLIRYFEEGRDNFKIKPEHVLYAASAFVAIEILIRFVS